MTCPIISLSRFRKRINIDTETPWKKIHDNNIVNIYFSGYCPTNNISLAYSYDKIEFLSLFRFTSFYTIYSVLSSTLTSSIRLCCTPPFTFLRLATRTSLPARTPSVMGSSQTHAMLRLLDSRKSSGQPKVHSPLRAEQTKHRGRKQQNRML